VKLGRLKTAKIPVKTDRFSKNIFETQSQQPNQSHQSRSTKQQPQVEPFGT
jgi:hypothetical protein